MTDPIKLTPEEAKRIRLALVFGDPAADGRPDPALEEAKRKLEAIQKGDGRDG